MINYEVAPPDEGNKRKKSELKKIRNLYLQRIEICSQRHQSDREKSCKSTTNVGFPHT